MRLQHCVRHTFVTAILAFITAGSVCAAQAASDGIPHLRRQGSATQLVVDGAPFLIRGGELANSTASDLVRMRPIWAKLRAMNLNTVIAPVYWEFLEPRENQFDFALVDSLITDARRNDMHLVLLWFGSWKNSMSSYVPEYVKANQARFPRTEATRGQGQEILSPFHAANWEADARAFATLMRHLRSFDGTRHTVVMVQVENETGMIPEARDHSPTADSLYARAVPHELISYLERHRDGLAPELRASRSARGNRTSGTWEDVFGPGVQTEELFMAWHFAHYHELVTAAGKREYPLPMYANAALIRPGYLPGRYVSAGPLPHLIDVWRAASPSTDFIAPDIYFPNVTEWTEKYTRSANPLFIPEARLTAQTSVDAFYVFAKHDAIGYSPFAIEGASAEQGAGSSLARSFGLLGQLAPLIAEHQGRGTMTGVMPPIAFDGTIDEAPQRISLKSAEYTLNVSFANPPGPPTVAAPGTAAPNAGPVSFSPGMPGATLPSPAAAPQPPPTPRGGLIIMLAPNEFLIAGTGMVVTFTPNGPGAPIAGILTADEMHFVDGRWERGLRMNGDQTHQGRHVALGTGQFTVQRVRLYRYR
jgi:beta-galactosidase GanA